MSFQMLNIIVTQGFRKLIFYNFKMSQMKKKIHHCTNCVWKYSLVLSRAEKPWKGTCVWMRNIIKPFVFSAPYTRIVSLYLHSELQTQQHLTLSLRSESVSYVTTTFNSSFSIPEVGFCRRNKENEDCWVCRSVFSHARSLLVARSFVSERSEESLKRLSWGCGGNFSPHCFKSQTFGQSLIKYTYKPLHDDE